MHILVDNGLIKCMFHFHLLTLLAWGERERERDDNDYDSVSGYGCARDRASVRREGINHLSHSRRYYVCLSANSDRALRYWGNFLSDSQNFAAPS